MTDHAVLIPSSVGPLGAIVSEPDGPRRGALLLLQGDGRPGRSGVNAVWTRFARRLARHGVLVLRFDYVGEGDGTMIPKDAIPGFGHKGEVDFVLLREVVAWLRARTSIADLLVFGDSLGGRLALELGRADPGVVGAFVCFPYVKNDTMPSDARRKEVGSARLVFGRSDAGDFHQNIVEAIPAILERGPVWILRGEKDSDEPDRLKHVLGRRGRALEIEVVPGMAVHPVSASEVQDEVTRRLARRVLRAVDDLSPVSTPTRSAF